MNTKTIIKFISVLFVFIIQFVFLFTILNERIHHYAVPYVIMGMFLLLILVYKKFPLHHSEITFDKLNLIVWIPIAAIITFILNNDVGLGGVFAAGIVGTLGSFANIINRKSEYLKQIAAPIYCGSFIGMSTLNLEYMYWIIVVSGLITALLFWITKSMFVGVGGKLGTLAFIGFLLSMLLFKLIH